MKYVVLTLAFILLFSGCTPRHIDVPRPKIKEDMALINFYRLGDIHARQYSGVNIYVNDKLVLNALENDYTSFYLQEGTYTFKARLGNDIQEKLTVKVEKNKQYFINYYINGVAPSKYEIGANMATDNAANTGELYGGFTGALIGNLVAAVVTPVLKPKEIESEKPTTELMLIDEDEAVDDLKNCRVQKNELSKNM